MVTACGKKTRLTTIYQKNYFEPTDNIAIVIGCSEYGILRKEEGKQGFKDIPNALGDARNVKRALKRISFKENEIRLHENPSLDKVTTILS